MAALNIWHGIGNLTRDPDLKTTRGGTTVCEFGIAVNDKRKDAQGNWVDEILFIDVAYFGRMAEVCNEFLTKGAPVYVDGKLKLNQWEKDGVRHSRITLVGGGMQMLGQRGGGDRTSQESQAWALAHASPASRLRRG